MQPYIRVRESYIQNLLQALMLKEGIVFDIRRRKVNEPVLSPRVLKV